MLIQHHLWVENSYNITINVWLVYVYTCMDIYTNGDR